MTTLSLTVTEDGLRLPRELFKRLGEVEVIEREDYVLIKPKAAPEPASDLRPRVRSALVAAGLAATPDWPVPGVITTEDRARLAQALSVGKALSEVIIDERNERE
jgi:hypothetical protein